MSISVALNRDHTEDWANNLDKTTDWQRPGKSHGESVTCDTAWFAPTGHPERSTLKWQQIQFKSKDWFTSKDWTL